MAVGQGVLPNGYVTIKGGGGEDVRASAADLRNLITFPAWGSSEWLSSPKDKGSAFGERFKLNLPLGRPPIYFWMDVLKAALSPADLLDPFKLSAMLTYAFSRYGGFSEKDSYEAMGVDGFVGHNFGLPLGTKLVRPPAVVRHYAEEVTFREILKSGILMAGAATYVNRISHKPRARNVWSDAVGVFVTTPGEQNTANAVGTGSTGTYYVDVVLPEEAVLMDLPPDRYGGRILLMFGPPGPGTGEFNLRSTEGLPHPPLKVPVRIVGVSKAGVAGDIVAALRPDLLSPSEAVVAGAMDLRGGRQVDTSTSSTSQSLSGGVSASRVSFDGDVRGVPVDPRVGIVAADVGLRGERVEAAARPR